MSHFFKHLIFGHKVYYLRTEGVEGFKDTHNIYGCLWCNEEFHSGVYWWLFDGEGKRIR